MSEIAGRMSAIEGAHYLVKTAVLGTLLGGVPGVLPGNVLVLWGRHCGSECRPYGFRVGCRGDDLEVDLEKCAFGCHPAKCGKPDAVFQ